MPYLAEFLTVAGLHLLAVMSPGPDFALVTRNSLTASRRAGLFSALGIALGIGVHVTSALVGVGLLLSRSALLFSIVRLLGAAYLLWIGWKSLRAAPHAAPLDATMEAPSLQQAHDLASSAALRMGFWTNVLNPKATLFFLSLFTQVISPATPAPIKALYGAEMALATFAWFALVATLWSHARVKARLSRMQHGLEKFMGVVLIGLGLWTIFEVWK